MNITLLKESVSLMRLNKPIGIFLLLWPTLWALWLSAAGQPDIKIVWVFVLGVIVMRSAGCVINDIADRHLDGAVERTRARPLAAGKISVSAALILFVSLLCVALGLVLLLNTFTIQLAFMGAALAIFYPFMKRFTHLPQIGLGVAFAWSVLMVFAAQTNQLSFNAWVVFSAAALWPVIYDTFYAMVDRQDDVRAGIKSTAILFGRFDKIILALLQISLLGLFIVIGIIFQLRFPYFCSLMIVAMLFCYQQFLIKERDRQRCFKAFLNNHWVGLIIFVGIVLSDSV